MKTKMPKFEKGDYPKAADFELMARTIEKLANVTISEGCGLSIYESETGWTINYTPPTQAKYVKITEEVTALDDTTLGRGKGKLHRVRYADNGDATLVDTKIEVAIYSAANDIVEVDALVQVKRIDGQYHIDWESCP